MNHLTNEYIELSKEELITLLQDKELQIESFLKEKEDEALLKFPWTGNLGHWYWEVKTNKVFFNSRKVTALGYAIEDIPEEIGFEFFTSKLHPEDYEPVMQNMRNHLSGKAEVYEVQYRIKTRSGEWKWYYDRGRITKYDEKGNPVLLAGIVFDITEQKNIEERQASLISSLSQQLNMNENIYSVIMHDLINPLSSIKGFSKLISELSQEKKDSSFESYLEIIASSAENALSIAKTMMDWIRAKKQVEEVNQDVNLYQLVEELKSEFLGHFQEKELVFVNAIHDDCFLYSNKAVLKIALRNFISNAIKYSKPGGRIEIRYEHNKIMIKDEGIGISMEKLAYMFTTKMYSTPGTKDETGNGIGLLLVKELLDQLNIDLQVESEEGKGTTIELILADKIGN